MRPVISSFLVVCLLLWAACAGAKSLKEVKHWEAVAQDVVGSLMKSMEEQERTELDTACFRTYDHSTFGRSLQTHLATAFMDQGVTPTLQQVGREECLNVSWGVQVVTHREPANLLSGTVMSNLVMMDYGVYKESGTSDAADVSTGEGTTNDYYATSFAFEEYNEVTITVTVDDDDLYLLRDSNTYYINDLDRRHYWSIPDFWEQPERLPETTYTTVTE